jgi:hypothetical protein
LSTVYSTVSSACSSTFVTSNRATNIAPNDSADCATYRQALYTAITTTFATADLATIDAADKQAICAANLSTNDATDSSTIRTTFTTAHLPAVEMPIVDTDCRSNDKLPDIATIDNPFESTGHIAADTGWCYDRANFSADRSAHVQLENIQEFNFVRNLRVQSRITAETIELVHILHLLVQGHHQGGDVQFVGFVYQFGSTTPL